MSKEGYSINQGGSVRVIAVGGNQIDLTAMIVHLSE